MENSGNTSAEINDTDTVQTFNPTALQQMFYPSLCINNTSTNDFDVSYAKASIETAVSGTGSFLQQQQQFTGVVPATLSTLSNVSLGPPAVHPTQKPALCPNLMNCTSPVAQFPAAPHTIQHPNRTYPPGRAGSLPLESQQSLDQYLTAPQSHLLQLHGTNPSGQPLQTDNFYSYGTNAPQNFQTFRTYMFPTDQSMKQPNVREVIDEESSSAFRETSHINRKKRKACGRCGPCRRKDNCGSCMNCINRAKGKQICIFRKCEELKKKPGAETTCLPVAPDHHVESTSVGQEKWKELEQIFGERKRSRIEDSNVALQQRDQLRPKFPALATRNQSCPQPHSVVQLASTQRPYCNPLPIQGSGGTFQHQVQRNNSSSNKTNLLTDAETINHSSGTPGSDHTTDIISEALHEIDYSAVERSELKAGVYSTVETSELKAVLHQAIPSSIPQQQQQSYQQQWSQNVPPANPVLNSEGQGVVQLPGQPPPLPPGPGPGASPQIQEASQQQFSSTPIAQPSTSKQTLPDQLLSNLTRFNEFGSFQGNNSSQSQGNFSNKRPPSVSRANYAETVSITNPLLYTPTVTNYNSIQGTSPAAVSVSDQPTFFSQGSTTSTPSSMYHNVCSLAYGNEEAAQNVNFQRPNSLISSQLHQQYNTQLVNSNMQHPPPIYQSAMPNGSFVAPEAKGFRDPPPFESKLREMQAPPFTTSLSQIPLEYQSFNLVMKPTTFPGQSTSNTAMAGQSGLTGHVSHGQGYHNSHSDNQQWAGGQYLTHPPVVPRHIGVGNTVPVEQKSSHSPESFHMESTDSRQIIGQVPKFTPSSVAQPPVSNLIGANCPKQEPTSVSSQFLDTSTGMETSEVRVSLHRLEGLSLPSAAKNSQPSEQLQDPSLSALSASQNMPPFSSGKVICQPSSLPSQSDANSTISPGESGYDSADIVHGSEDTTSQQVLLYNITAENERDTVSNDLNGPKNLYRAPVGAKADNHDTCEIPNPQLKSYLPSAGALKLGKASEDKIDMFHDKESTRRFSHDSGMELFRSEKRSIKIRRYSLPENDRRDVPDSLLLSKTGCNWKLHSVTKSSYSSTKCWSETLTTQANITSPDGTGPTNYKGTLVGQRRIATFDTPPLTPRSGDFVGRWPSIDPPIENAAIGPKIGDILPTPPHMGESHSVKFAENISHRGFKPQTDNSSPRRTEFAPCRCIEGTDGRTDEAPYYTHLGAAESVAGIRRLFERRTGYSGSAIRIEKVIYTGKEGKTSRGCPMAKWIIRRSGEHEKVLVVCRQRPGHHCATAVIAVIILLWDGVARPLADFAYANFTNYVPKHGEPTERRCATNDDRTCACQGFDESTCGASFSFGCSWSMYYNGCKYARSNNPNKFKLTGTKDQEAERFIGVLCEKLATVMSPLYEMAAPDAFHNQVEFEEDGYECRLGEGSKKNSRPFSGVTSCLDFCAHAHKDQHNMDNGSTVVVTFTKPELRTIGGKHSDEQLHVLPLCKLDISNEQGSLDGVAEKIENGSLEILQRYRHEVRLRSKPKLSKKQKSRAKKKTDTSDSSLCKRRGRPPKRTNSVENLLEDYEAKMTRNSSANRYQYRMQSGVQLSTSCPSETQGITPQSQPGCRHGPLSPTRWPYKRPVLPHGDGGVIPKPQTHSQQIKGYQNPHQSPPPPDSHSLLDNLPSIGNFFRPETGGCSQNDDGSITFSEHSLNSAPSQTLCHQVPNMKFQVFTSSSSSVKSENSHANIANVLNSSPFPNLTQQGSVGFMSPPRMTPLPSIKDVVMHPFHQNFAAVSTDPSEVMTHQVPQQTPPRNDHVTQIDTSTPIKSPAIQGVVPSRYLSDCSPCLDPRNTKHSIQVDQTIICSDSEENFRDSEIGGVAVAPGHGSVLIECAKKELHATTALHRPNRLQPSRISLVFYQHKNMNARNHGAAQYVAKEEERRKQREEKRLEEMLKPQEGMRAGMRSPLHPGMHSPFPRDHFPTIVFQNADQRNDQVTPERRTSHHAILSSHLQPPILGDAVSRRQILLKQDGSTNEQASSHQSMDFGTVSPAMRSTWPTGESIHRPVQGWPRSIFQPGYRFSSTHSPNMNQMYIRHNTQSDHRPPSIPTMAQSPVNPMPSPNGMQYPHTVITARPMPFQQAQSPPGYAPHVRQQVYRLSSVPSQHYPYSSQLQAGVCGPLGPNTGMAYPRTQGAQQLTMVGNAVRAPITPMK